MPPVFYARRRRWPLAAAVTLILGAIAVVLLVRASTEPAATDLQAETPADAEIPLQHVHGLGIDPLQGTLYAATHSGLVRFSGHGGAEHVGDNRDLMGFTVLGPDRFLASGHPDVAGIRDGLPGHLGLLESTNGGADWSIVSLGGEADLHAIAHADGQVYAVDSKNGRFLASSDLRTWESRAPSAATSMAIDPENHQRVVAADGAELQVTGDGGRTWRPLQGPPLLYVAWSTGTGLWGVTADGSTHVRAPSDGTWRELNRLPGEPQAVLSDGATMYAAAHVGDETTIQMFRSGRWQEQHAAP